MGRTSKDIEELQQTTLERIVSARLGRPAVKAVKDWLAEGLTVIQCRDKIEEETGVPLGRATLYVWLKRDAKRRESTTPHHR